MRRKDARQVPHQALPHSHSQGEKPQGRRPISRASDERSRSRRSADARDATGRTTPKRDRPNAWLRRTAHRGWNALKGQKPQERRPVKTTPTCATARHEFARPTRRNTGPPTQVRSRSSVGQTKAIDSSSDTNPRASTPRRNASASMTPPTDATGENNVTGDSLRMRLTDASQKRPKVPGPSSFALTKMRAGVGKERKNFTREGENL